MPSQLHLQISRENLIACVPTFHLQAHNTPCHAPFSFNFKHGMGHIDGEGPERNWAALNGAAPSTKEMGPGARSDTLDDFCNFHNWKKIISYGKSQLFVFPTRAYY